MTVIDLEADGFSSPYAHVNYSGTFPLTVEELTCGILTAGRANWVDVFNGGALRWLEMQGLAAQTHAYVEAGSHGLRMSALYEDLDGSEKGAFSYRLGMGLAKAIASHHMGVPWLYHLDRVRSAITLQSGKARPDLVGPDGSLRFHVVEAKARQTSTAGVELDSKNQAARVIAVSGTPPATTIASVAALGKDPIRVRFTDPLPNEADDTKIDIDTDAFLVEYYSPFLLAEDWGVDFAPEIRPELPGRPTYMVAKLEATPYRLGIRKDVLDILRSDVPRASEITEALASLRQFAAERGAPPHGVAIQPDGVILISDAPAPTREVKKTHGAKEKRPSSPRHGLGVAIREGTPTSFDQKSLDAAAKLLLDADEADPNTGPAGLRGAQRIALAYQGEKLVGVGAIKAPKNRKSLIRLAQRGRAAIPRGAVELGYFVVDPAAKGARVGSQLAAHLAPYLPTHAFATTRTDNEPMHRILEARGFKAQPGRWMSERRPGVMLMLWTRTSE